MNSLYPHCSARSLISVMNVSLSAKTFLKWFRARTEGAITVIIVFHFIYKPRGVTFNQCIILVDGRVVDLNSFDIEVLGVFLVQHRGGNVRDVLSGITLSGDVHLAALQPEGVHKPFPKVHKLLRDIRLVVDRWWSRGEPRSGRLVHPDHVG